MMPDLIYYCIKENNDCPKRHNCERYLNVDAHNCKTTLFKIACTDDNNRILFIETGKTSTDDGTKEDDATEQTT